MKVKKTGGDKLNPVYYVELTGITHPKDNHPVEFTLHRSVGSYRILFPSYYQPSHLQVLEMSPGDKIERQLIDKAQLFKVIKWAISDIREHYSAELKHELKTREVTLW